jgi:hypothetical protein
MKKKQVPVVPRAEACLKYWKRVQVQVTGASGGALRANKRLRREVHVLMVFRLKRSVMMNSDE